MRTSDDANNLLLRSQEDGRNALDAPPRADYSQSIYVSEDIVFRQRVRAMAAMRAPSVMH